MRISDWSSDVCSSDLLETAKAALEKIGGLTVATNTAVVNSRGPRAKAAPAAAEPAAGGGDGDGDTLTHVDEGNVTDRKSVVEGKRVSVRVDLGWSLTIKTKNKQKNTTCTTNSR